MARLLVTGATGWIGALLAQELHARGHALLLLARGERAVERLREMFGHPLPADVAVIQGDVSRPEVLDPGESIRWRGQVDALVHLAALVRLDASADAEVMAVNDAGTGHALALATELGTPAFCHMSSCSVAGDAPVLGESEVDVGQAFRNAYERSKAAAEKRVLAWPGRGLILRVPGLLGDSVTGATGSFTGTYYDVLATYWALREDLLAEWQAGGESALEEDGISFDSDGCLHLPDHVTHSRQIPFAVVPQDWLARMAAELIERDADGIVNLVHPSPPTAGWALRSSLAHLKIAPTARAARRETPGPWRRLVRRSYERMLGAHAPYLSHVARFPCERLPRLLGPAFSPPPLDESVLARAAAYGVSKGFGR